LRLLWEGEISGSPSSPVLSGASCAKYAIGLGGWVVDSPRRMFSGCSMSLTIVPDVAAFLYSARWVADSHIDRTLG
jgi:hypothetical protein